MDEPRAHFSTSSSTRKLTATASHKDVSRSTPFFSLTAKAVPYLQVQLKTRYAIMYMVLLIGKGPPRISWLLLTIQDKLRPSFLDAKSRVVRCSD
jgi:hypothetical protein